MGDNWPPKRKQTWQQYLASRGPDTVVTEDNLAKYAPVEQYREPARTVPARTGPSHVIQLSQYGVPPPDQLSLLKSNTDTEQHVSASADGGDSGHDHSHSNPAASVSWDREPILEDMGHVYSTFSWRQSTSELEIRLPVPRDTRGRELTVKLTPNHILVKHARITTPLIDHELWSTIYVGSNSDDKGSFWAVEDGQLLRMTLQKWVNRSTDGIKDASQTWWRALFKGEPEFSAAHPPGHYYSTKSLD